MQVMNWEQMKNSPATRGFVAVSGGALDLARFLLKVTFKPAFMTHLQNAENDVGLMARLQIWRTFVPAVVVGLSGVTLKEWNGQLNLQNVAFTLGVAFLASGWVDMAGLGLQAIGENRE